MYQKKKKHFSLHVGTHFVSVLAVFGVALLSGYIAKESHVDFRGLLAATLSGTNSTILAVPQVTFSVAPGSAVKCDLATPRTSVVFSVSDVLGGGFMLSINSTSGSTSVAPGEHYLPNGTYHWNGVVKMGYVGSGAMSGDFVLNNTCPTAPISTITTAAEPIGPSLDQAIFPEIWYAGSRLAPSSTAAGEPTIKIYVPGALHASFEVGGTSFSPKLFTEQNGVVRISGTNVWTIDPAQLNLSDGIYKVVGFYETSAGRYYTQPVSFNINSMQSTAPIENTAATQPPPSPLQIAATSLAPASSTVTSSSITAVAFRPVLSVFVDNTPVTDSQHAFSNGDIELRIKTSPAKRVTLYAASSTSIALGNAVKDDLLSNDKYDVWSFVWNVEVVPAGMYKVFARVSYPDGHLGETLQVNTAIVHEPTVIPPISRDSFDMGVTATSGVSDNSARGAILSRVTAPELCVNKEECQIYCASHPEEKERCVAFVRTILERPLRTPVSLADGIDPARVQAILSDQKRSKEIPGEVSTPEKLRDFCAELSHADVCAKVLVRNDLASQSALDTKRELLAGVRKEERQIFIERIGARAFVDSDMDGISDYDEVNIYHTDPNDQDTDHDGFPDGAEIIAHTNPLGGKGMSASTTVIHDEFVKLENPRLSGAASPDLLAVESVLLATSSAAQSSSPNSKLTFTGHALPNSFVTLYIFSEPIVMTVKTDEFGSWTYTFDKVLSDGSHEVYSTITDSGGHILAKSEPLPFVKTASAVSFGAEALLPTNAEPGFFSGASLYAFIAIIIGILGIAFSVIGFIVRRRDTENISIE